MKLTVTLSRPATAMASSMSMCMRSIRLWGRSGVR